MWPHLLALSTACYVLNSQPTAVLHRDRVHRAVCMSIAPLPQTPAPEEAPESGGGWKRTGDGLKFRQVTSGSGAIPSTGSVVKLHYSISFQNGDLLGTTRGKGMLTFCLGRHNVPIFDDAVQSGMRIGDAIRLVVPAEKIPISQSMNVPKDQYGEPLLIDIQLAGVETGALAIIPSILPPGRRRLTIARLLFALSFVPYFLPEDIKPDAYRFGDPVAIHEAKVAASNSQWLGGAAVPLDSLFP